MKIAYGQAVFYKKREGVQVTGQWTLPLADIMENHELKGEIRAKLLDKTQWIPEGAKSPKNKCALSWDRIQEKGLDLTLRFRRQGDYIVPSGMKGRKKLQDYFVDGKIPKEERDLLPLLCIGSEVLWVIGKRTNENYRITEETERILLLEYSYKM